jgi:MFS family permease
VLFRSRKHPKEILLAAGSFVAPNGCFYLIIVFTVSYAVGTHHLDRPTVLWAVLLGALLTAGLTPFAGWLSDRIGRRAVFLGGAVITGLWSLAYWPLVDQAQFLPLLLAIGVGLGAQSLMYAPQAALFAELFSTEVRYSGASMGYQIGAIFGGGFAPIIAQKLHDLTGKNAMSVGIYMAVLCTVSFLSVLALTETSKRGHLS